MRSECSNPAPAGVSLFTAVSNLAAGAFTWLLPLSPRARLIELREDQLHALKPISSTRIECIAGTIWLTQAGDNRDVILHAGMSFTPVTQREVVIQPLQGGAKVHIS